MKETLPIEAELALTEQVGRELVRLGLPTHAANARIYYADVRAGRQPKPRGWTHELIVEWARLLRLPPYENDYPVRPRSWSCTCDSPRPYTARIFPGGARICCDACKLTWLEFD